MLTVETPHAIHQDHAKGMPTAALRQHFLAKDLFADSEIRLIYTHYDRFVMAAAVPAGGSLTLDKVVETRTASFLERREMGIVNICDTGSVEADGDVHTMHRGDVLYLGVGSGAVTFKGQERFYLTSAPAHRQYPSKLLTISEANQIDLGAAETANERSIRQFIHPQVMESCQLVIGYTTLRKGSVRNTMPAHVHDRRMEAYLYFDLAPENRVLHLMGAPNETRHLIIANEQGVLSPSWSIHAGAGTGDYTFIWAMAGDNIDYTDMDMVPAKALL